MIEHEKKLLLTKDEYEYLLVGLGKDKPIVKQTNYYFDTEDFSMNSQNTTCRIRLKDEKYKGTIKKHTSNANYSTETEIEVRNGIRDNGFIDMGLILQGNLVTERLILLKNEVCEVVLDKNCYLGHTDHELEIEYLPEHEQTALVALKVIFDLLQYKYPLLTESSLRKRVENVSSKSKRFFDRKINSNYNT